MPYTLKNSRNTTIETVADAALLTTLYGIQFPGKNYASYGDPIVQSIYHLLENFACPNSGSDTPVPINPIVNMTNPPEGQLWFDTTNSKLMVFNGSSWEVSSGAAHVATTPPGSPSEGDMWYNSTTNQLFAYDGSAWVLIGPEFSTTDNTYSTGFKINAGGTGGAGAGDAAAPTGGTVYNAFGTWVDGALVSVSSDTQIMTPTYYYIELNDGSSNVRYFTFSPYGGLIEDGVTIGNGATDYFNGRAKVADTADSLSGSSATAYMSNLAGASADLSRRPATGSLDVGNASFRWGTMYADIFDGVSTSAQWADLAERYEIDIPAEAGSLVKIGGIKEITMTKNYHDEDVFGVISTNPAFKMNSSAGSAITHPYVALVGRVPVKVTGIVSKGDRLASSGVAGAAIAITNDQAKANGLIIIGRALEDKTYDAVGLVEVAITGAK